uniref:Tumor protein p53 binding protein, 2a n=1 Tax=Sphaeramia orbicularis TaxID=375764 RepID=A0A673BI57_9TELE
SGSTQHPENPYLERRSPASENEVDHSGTLSPTKLLPFISNPYRHQSDGDLEALRKKLYNAPRPLKKRSSITEPEGPAGPNIQKLLYQKTTLSYGNHCRHSNHSHLYIIPHLPFPSSPRPDDVLFPPPPPAGLEDTLPSLPPPPPEGFLEEFPPYPPPPYPSGAEQDSLGEDTFNMKAPEVTGQVTLPPGKRTNLRKPGSERIDHSMRVKFNPLALLLDSSLEGEFDLVQRIIYEVEDPSQPNDEGITALHNAVCAGHTEIVKFLVQFGVNVNADASTLCCSCNNVQVCKFLVESGAAVFAMTYSDMQTACSQFLTVSVQEKMGIMNRGVVYGLWDYTGENPDELPFREGDCMTILRREDEDEIEWGGRAWATLRVTFPATFSGVSMFDKTIMVLFTSTS